MAALFAVIDWDDGFSNDIPLSAIQNPRKCITDYCVGERVEARLSGFPGLHWGNIAAIDGDRKWLKEKLKGPRPITPKEKGQRCKKTTEVKKNEHLGDEEDYVGQRCKKPTEEKKNEHLEDEEDYVHSDDEYVPEEVESESDSEEDTPVEKNNKKSVGKGRKRRLSDLQVVEKDNSVKKTDKSALKEDKQVSDEAKKLKKELNKKKAETIKERAKVETAKAFKLLPSMETTKAFPAKPVTECCQCNKDDVKRVEGKLDEILGVLNHLYDCRPCLKKGYKRVIAPATDILKTPLAKPFASGSDTSTTTPSRPSTPSGSAMVIPTPISMPTPIGINAYTCVPSTSGSTSTSSGYQDCGVGNDMESGQTKKGESSEVNLFEDELCFLGDAVYGIKVNAMQLKRAIKVSKTPEKLALNLVPIILSKEEINTITVYGNKQFQKAAMDDRKREALKSCIFSTFNRGEKEKEDIWDKLVTAINDKIRGLRKGKYKGYDL